MNNDKSPHFGNGVIAMDYTKSATTKHGGNTMSYKHILVALDPSEDSNLLLEKAVMLAKVSGAELSFMSADEVYGIDHKEKFEAHKGLVDYPIKNILVGENSISERIEKAVKEEGVDLVVCYHHHDFWHALFSTAADLMKTVDVDLFVVSVPK